MATDDIRGTVTDADGNAVEGAVVEVTPAEPDGLPEEQTVVRTTTDANGDYVIEYHPNGDGTSRDWHAAAYWFDSGTSTWFPAANRPGVTASLPAPIPDSVEHRWTLSEGSGSTAADSVGSNDMSINGATWISGNYVDGYALDPDGTDDYGLVSTFYDSANVIDHGLAFTIDDLTQNGTNIMGTRSNGFVLLYDGANEPNAAPSLRLRDDTGTDVYFIQPAVDLNDGNKHRLIFNIPSANANDAEIYVDGSSVSVNVEFNNSYSGSVTLDSDTAFFARSTDGSISNNNGTPLDDIQFNADQYSASEAQDDYNRQPWS